MKKGIRTIISLLCILGLGACNTDPEPKEAADTRFTTQQPQLFSDPTGIEAARTLLSAVETVVVLYPGGSQDIAIATAKNRQAPLLIDNGSNSEAIAQLVKELNAKEEKITEQGKVKPETVETLLANYQPSNSDLVVLVTAETDIPSVLSAMSAGATIELLPVADPRASTAVVAGRQVPIYAFGSGFKNFDTKLQLAKAGPVPSGDTGLVFPGRRLVALYGHPSGPALGVLGEQDPTAAVERVQALVKNYDQVNDDPQNSFVPAFEIITTVATSAPGDDGDYSNETAIEDLQPYVDAIGKAGGFAILDLQPGRASFLEQARLYEPLLKLPHVGLALDPEWKIGPEEQPLSRVGSVSAAEINEVSAWLAELVRENNLPQKVFVLHQFQQQMIADRENVDVTHLELAYVLHADGHGEPGHKFETWNMLREGLQPEFYLAWKNFYDEDTPMLTPGQTMMVKPRPWFISYQ